MYISEKQTYAKKQLLIIYNHRSRTRRMTFDPQDNTLWIIAKTSQSELRHRKHLDDNIFLIWNITIFWDEMQKYFAFMAFYLMQKTLVCFYSLFFKPSNSIPSSYEVHKFNFQLFNLVTAMVSIYLIFKILTFFALFLWLNAEIFCFYSNLPHTGNMHIFF